MYGFCPLASGSKGNAIYLGTKTTRILIDAGISFSSLCKRLAEINVDIQTIQAVVITHEHTDHIQGLPTLSQKLNIPILANGATAKGIYNALQMKPRFKIFTTGEPFVFGDIEVRPFGIPHDTLDPVAFTMHVEGLKLGFCADIGHVTSMVIKELEGCDYLYVEANHQPSMVHASHRPQVYKQRVLGRQGHLSNEECASLISSILHKKIKHIHLAHLSKECNHEELVLQIVGDAIQHQVPLSIAYQDRISRCIYF